MTTAWKIISGKSKAGTAVYAFYNPSPYGRSVGDCAVRALSKALDQSWEKTYVGLCLEGFKVGDLPNADSVWGRYLKDRGFDRYFIPDDTQTVAEFAERNPRGTFVLSMPGRHVVTVVNGQYCDSWDSGNELPEYYWTRN